MNKREVGFSIFLILFSSLFIPYPVAHGNYSVAELTNSTTTTLTLTETLTETRTETTTLWNTISSTLTSLFTSSQTSTVYSPTVYVPTFTLTTVTTNTTSIPFTVYYGVTTIQSTTVVPVTTTSTSTEVQTATSTTTKYTGTTTTYYTSTYSTASPIYTATTYATLTSYLGTVTNYGQTVVTVPTTTVTVQGVTYQTVFTGVSTITSQYVQTISDYVTTRLGGTLTTYATNTITNTSYIEIPTTTGIKYVTETTHATLTDHTTVTETLPYIPPVTTSQNANLFGFSVPRILAENIGWIITGLGVVGALGGVGLMLAVKKGRISTRGGLGQLIQSTTGVQTTAAGPDLTEPPIPPEAMVGTGGEANPPPPANPTANIPRYCAKCGDIVPQGQTECLICHHQVSEPISAQESEASAEELGKLQGELGGLP